MNRDVPFYPNTSDDTHCYQAALRMVLGHFEPDSHFSWEFLDEVTHKLPDMWTWPMSGLMWLQSRGYDVKNIEVFDYSLFSELGEKYLKDTFGEEVAAASIEYTDISSEMKIAEDFCKSVQTDLRLPDYTDLRELIHDGFLVIANVNAHVLSDKPGYVGHFVVVTAVNGDELILQDPGLPAFADRHVSAELFQAAWAYPDESSKNIMAIKKP